MKHTSIRIVPLAAFALALMAGPALAQSAATVEVALGKEEIYDRSLAALTILFVAAILIENALATLFNWRVFLTYFSLRGVRTIIAIAVSLIVVWTFDLDVVVQLFNAYRSAPSDSTLASQVLTALILAGGSSGVHNFMAALGYRDRGREQAVTPQVEATEAWVAIRVERQKAVGPVEIQITEVEAPDPPPGAIAGTVGFRRPSLGELLFRNTNRFPPNGGYVVEPGKVYRIDIVGHDAKNARLPDPLSGRMLRFAPGAIVDFEVTL
jgi:hypothetical protein